MKTHCDMVREFMTEVAGQACPTVPTKLDADTLRLRLRLIAEEFDELLDSALCLSRDGIGMAESNSVNYTDFIDALADLEYVIAGTYVAIGIDGEAVFQEVHRSNMAKKGGHLNEVGKFIKPATWTPPNIQQFVESFGDDDV